MDNFQIIHFHHPLLLKNLSFLNIGKEAGYIDIEGSEKLFNSQYNSYIKPRLQRLIAMAEVQETTLVYFSISFLEQLEKADSEFLLEVQEVVNKGKLQLAGSCAYHSFSYLCSHELFHQEALLHKNMLKKFFKAKPEIFINTACLYDDDIAGIVQSMGYKSIIATANTWHLAGKHSGQIYRANLAKEFNILLANGDEQDGFQISLINGYGSAYTTSYIDGNAGNKIDVKNLLSKTKKKERPVYAVSLPLTSPSWEHKIPDYTNNPLQKALLHQISELFKSKGLLKDANDVKILMLLCQPDHLMSINQFSKDSGYNQFISSMNILTDLSLKHQD